jgi:hypothetical protein
VPGAAPGRPARLRRALGGAGARAAAASSPARAGPAVRLGRRRRPARPLAVLVARRRAARPGFGRREVLLAQVLVGPGGVVAAGRRAVAADRQRAGPGRRRRAGRRARPPGRSATSARPRRRRCGCCTSRPSGWPGWPPRGRRPASTTSSTSCTWSSGRWPPCSARWRWPPSPTCAGDPSHPPAAVVAPARRAERTNDWTTTGVLR